MTCIPFYHKYEHAKPSDIPPSKNHALILTVGFSMQALRLIIQELKDKNSINKKESHRWIIISRDGNTVECDLNIPVTPHTSIYTDTIFNSITLLTGSNHSLSPILSIFLKRKLRQGVKLAALGPKAANLPLFHYHDEKMPWLTCNDLHAIPTLVHRLLNETEETGLASKRLDSRLDNAITLIHNNIDEPLQPEELAFHLGLSRRQLERLFRKHLNTTPAKYSLQARLWEAKKLLQTTSKTLLQTGLACGFSNASHFGRTYRNYFGISPGQEKRKVLTTQYH